MAAVCARAGAAVRQPAAATVATARCANDPEWTFEYCTFFPLDNGGRGVLGPLQRLAGFDIRAPKTFLSIDRRRRRGSPARCWRTAYCGGPSDLRGTRTTGSR